MTSTRAQDGQGIREFVFTTFLVMIVMVVSVRLFARSSRCAFDPARADLDDTASLTADCPENRRANTVVVASGSPAAETAGSSSSGASRQSVFENPSENGTPLDHCLGYGRQCNNDAADAFCTSKGFARSSAFTLGAPVAKTYIVADHIYCDFQPPHEPVCQPFGSITCSD